MNDTRKKYPTIQGKQGTFTYDYTGYKFTPGKLIVGPGSIALEMVIRWGAVAGSPDGEDSAGRAKTRVQTPAEVVERACETAAALWAELDRRGWLETNPAPIEREDS